MNLVTDAWIPVVHRSGARRTIRPAGMADRDDPPIDLATVRPDFHGALAQLLVGLVQSVATPADSTSWREWYETPPGPEELDELLRPLAPAFELDGDGPRFLQDFEMGPHLGDPTPVADLLIDLASGGSNDHFLKDAKVTGLCSACAASALQTLQVNATSGGRGHRTGIRGGGPMTTLVVPDQEDEPGHDTLWHMVWLNVLDQHGLASLPGGAVDELDRTVFPWLAPTRTSERGSGRPSTTEDHPALHALWAMPRRIRLADAQPGDCDLCGAGGPVYRSYLRRPYGMSYEGGWRHPHGPYNEESQPPSPVHVQRGGAGYRQWLALVFDIDSAKIKPAVVVTAALERYENLGAGSARLWAFGYDTENAKARCWYDETMPITTLTGGDPARLDAVREAAAAMVETAWQVASNLGQQLRKAWQGRRSDLKGDLAFVRQRFWQETEGAFFRLLGDVGGSVGDEPPLPILREWHRVIDGTSRSIFDALAARGDIGKADPRSIADARVKLYKFNRSEKIKAALGLDVSGTTSAA